MGKGFIKKQWRNIALVLLLINLIAGAALPAVADTIRIQAPPALSDLTNVNATAPSDSDVLTWNDALGQWINAAGGSLNLTTLQDAVDNLQADVVTLQGDLSTLNATVSGHTIDIGILQGHVSDIQGDIGTLQGYFSALNITVGELAIDVGILQGDVSDLQGDISALQGDVSDIQGDISSLQGTVSDLVSDVSDLQGAVSDLEGRMNTAEGDISDLQDDLSALNTTVSGHTSDIGGLQGNVTGLKDIAIIYVIDGGGSAITTGEKGHLDIPFDCTITSWTLLADQSGSIVIDVWNDTYANFPPTVADTIAGAEKPTLTATQKNQDLDLGTWTTSVSAGDILAFNVDSCSTVTRVTLTITATRVI